MRRLVDSLALLGGAALVAYSGFVTLEVFGRRFFGYSLQGVDEIGGYLMATVTALGLSFALYERAHVRIDLLLPKLPLKVAMWLNVAAIISLFGFALFLLGRAWVVLSQSFSIWAVSPTPLRTPLVIPQAIWSLALLLFVAATLEYSIRAISYALRHRPEQVAELAGSSTATPQD